MMKGRDKRKDKKVDVQVIDSATYPSGSPVGPLVGVPIPMQNIHIKGDAEIENDKTR